LNQKFGGLIIHKVIYPINISQSHNIVKRRDGSWFLDAEKIRLKAKAYQLKIDE